MIKQAKKETRTLVNFKVTPEERKALVEKARKYTDGNVSLWIRYASVNLEPKSSDLIEK